MPTNDFKPFATAGGANVSTQAEYLALAALSTGWQSGKASSKEINKAVRQATFIAAAVAQFIADKGAVDVLDDGDLAGIGIKLIAALNKTSQPLDATLTALAALVGTANKLPYFNGDDAAALTDLTSVGRDLIGKTDIAAVLTYLGISDNTVPVGIPMPWPLAIPPAGWIKCNGATFTLAQYPKLAAIFTGLQVPDLRGEFIRGWDDGRGVDTGRAMQVPQGDAMRNLDGEVGYVALVGNSHQSGVLTTGGAQNQLMIGTDPGKITTAQSVFFNARNQVPTASEFRPRNISFNYIIRAA